MQVLATGREMATAGFYLKAAHAEGLKYNVALPFNALASVLLFDSMGKTHKPNA